ncbi:MAG: PLDc N-terminal domain-containing protein [Actinomycetota bacterium]|nr:PLDc N-terminal domain-containing protein [Actinomycetota bacterium]
MSDIPWAAVAPLLVLALGFAIYCWVDISRNDVKYLPKWAWAVIAVISIPIGGIIYLAIGRESR